MYRLSAFSLAFLVSASLTTAASANDAQGAYVNIGVTQLSTELDLTQTNVGGQTANLGTQSSNITMLTGRVGYRLNDYFALEGEAGFGLGGDDFTQAVPVDLGGVTANVDTNIGLDVKNYYVGFARAILPVSEQFDVFLRGGYGEATAEADITASFAGVTAAGAASDKASGFAYGIG